MIKQTVKAILERIRSIPVAYMMMSAYGIVITMIILILSVVFYYNAKGVAINTHKESNYRLLNETIAQLDVLNDTITSFSFFGANNAELKQLLKTMPEDDQLQSIKYQNKIRDILTQYWMIKPEIVGITIYTEKTKSIDSNTINVSSIDFAEERGWIDKLGDKRGIFLCDGNLYSRGTHGSSFSILTLVKVLDDKNKILGYLSFELSESYIYKNYINRNKASKNSEIFIFNEDGRIISHRDKALLGKMLKENYPFVNLESEQRQYSEIIRNNGVETLLIVTDKNNLGWRAMELIPVGEIFLAKRSIMLSVAMVAFIAFLIAVPLMWFISNLISRPIVKLSTIMDDKMPLDISKKEDYRRQNNEIGVLYRNYYQMIDRINTLIEQVKFSFNTMRRAEINALQAQINPHFMYNTLDYINWLAQDSNMPDISRMLTHLSRFLRLSLSDSCAVCTLQNELEHTNAYLEIFKVRYGNKFNYSVSTDPSLTRYFVPKFILQPLLENAIIHGFKQNIAGAMIKVSVVRGTDSLIFDVCDNGVGMSKEQLDRALRGEGDENRKSREYGIKNVNDRIQFICGNKYGGLKLIESGQGTRIRFELPIRDNSDSFEV